jgi:hypothetical protein
MVNANTLPRLRPAHGVSIGWTWQTADYSNQCSIDATRRKRQQKPQQRTCIVCKDDFTPERSDALTCSHRCRQKAYRDRARDNKKQVTISPASNCHGNAEA